MNLIDIKYVDYLSLYLTRVKKKSNNEWNFRCPLCGDSFESESKARGWIFAKANSPNLFFFCFNCQASMLFPTFLKAVNVPLYNDYIMEKFQNSKEFRNSDYEPCETPETIPEEIVDVGVLSRLRKLSQYPVELPAVQYVVNRKIPWAWHKKLYFAQKFKKFVNGIIPDKFLDDVEKDDPRIVIPFFSVEGKLIGFQGRSIDPTNKVKYITISLYENQSVMFGLNEYDPNSDHLVLEGPIDAMFCRNSIAIAGSISKSTTGVFNEHSIFVFDNEPRAKHTCSKIQSIINNGYKIALFPKNVTEKDVNDYVINYPDKAEDLVDHLYNSASGGAEAQMKFNDWKKI